jgi:hypothetical protein
MAPTDVRNERRTLKRRIKAIEQRIKQNEERIKQGERPAPPNYVAAFLPLLKQKKPRGRPPTHDRDRRQLLIQISTLANEKAAGQSDTELARLLGADPEDQYLRQRVGDAIHFVMENFTRPKPNESRRSRRDRALDLILRFHF